VPVIGVAKSGWTVDQLKERARASLTEHGGVDEDAFRKLSGLLRYIDGDYADPATFQKLRQTLGPAKHPTHYLAIPPSLFGAVIEALGKSGCADGARVVIEKPFGHDLASAGELNATLLGLSEPCVFRIDHYLGKEAVENPLFFRFANTRSSSRSGTATWTASDHDGGEIRHSGARQVLRRDRYDPTSFRTISSRSSAIRDGAA
jgi:glucose-6-phosphate 1-dehydrogenase